MSDAPAHWGEFTPRRGGSQSTEFDEDFDTICMQALTGPAGTKFIAALRERFIERPENPHAPEAVLRVRVTQQQFIRDLEAARDRGFEAVRRKAKAD